MYILPKISIEWTGTYLDDYYYGTAMDDRVWAYGGDDFISVGNGDDVVYAGNGDDTVFGGNGDDLMKAGANDDMLFGGNGDDSLWGEHGNDVIFGGDGDDYINAGFGDDLAYGGAGNDILHGHAGNDVLDGGTGNDVHQGASGNDRMLGNAGQDHYDGGTGWDILDFTNANAQIRVQLDLGRGFWNESQGDTYENIEEVWGSDYNDLLDGDDGGNVLRGNGGRDNMDGGAGVDHLHGGTNDGGFPIGDLMTGGADTDVFYFAEGESGGTTTKDIITDFVSGEDLIVIDGDPAVFNGLMNGFAGQGAQLSYHYTLDQYFGWMTEIEYRDDVGPAPDIEVQLVGIHQLAESDFFVF